MTRFPSRNPDMDKMYPTMVQIMPIQVQFIEEEDNYSLYSRGSQGLSQWNDMVTILDNLGSRCGPGPSSQCGDWAADLLYVTREIEIMDPLSLARFPARSCIEHALLRTWSFLSNGKAMVHPSADLCQRPRPLCSCRLVWSKFFPPGSQSPGHVLNPLLRNTPQLYVKESSWQRTDAIENSRNY